MVMFGVVMLWCPAFGFDLSAAFGGNQGHAIPHRHVAGGEGGTHIVEFGGCHGGNVIAGKRPDQTGAAYQCVIDALPICPHRIRHLRRIGGLRGGEIDGRPTTFRQGSDVVFFDAGKLLALPVDVTSRLPCLQLRALCG